MDLAPICLFTYNRLEETKQTISALQKNNLAKESRLYVFSDGAKNKEGELKIQELRVFLKSIDGFKHVVIFESKKNNGLANSIINGVTKIINQYGKVIVLEDDLITAPNFLDFMNQALEFYNKDKTIFSISGYTMDLPSLKGYDKDFYLGYRASSWGWASWKDKWSEVDWQMEDYKSFITNSSAKKKFKRGGSDMLGMLKRQMNGEIDSWAIRWCYHHSVLNGYCVYPSLSKIFNIGVGENSTHTKNGSDFNPLQIDKGKKQLFKFEYNDVNERIINDFRNVFSIARRFKRKFL